MVKGSCGSEPTTGRTELFLWLRGPFAYPLASIFTPATTSTTASKRRMVIGASRRLPSSEPINPPIKAAGAHHTISGGTFFTLAR